ncbi:hypothetical protein [Streptomyces sp. H39-C1]|uniref:hypothetical protein n=1 Tax=Streptomyces sp. H39-C1 TaxID=3004355 RepID=UPI0022AF0A27|nr:hypothetical protein [Streptomyces sp. H39-C1]MCZ4099859.1 hypothetical protein [Streptomyces sp. H39-C1]
MRITDYDHVNHREMTQILAIVSVAALRKGELTTRQKQRIDRILAAATKRETGK